MEPIALALSRATRRPRLRRRGWAHHLPADPRVAAELRIIADAMSSRS